MDKELECLKRIDMKLYVTEREHKIFYSVVEQALLELKSIKEATPSEALECLEEVNVCLETKEDYSNWEKQYNTIKQALIKAEKEHNSVNLLMQELDCKDFADLRKYARCGYEKLKSKEIS